MVSLETVVIVNALCFGLLTVLIASSKKAWAEALSIDEVQVGRWRFFNQVAFVPLVVLAGWFVDNWGPRPAILIGIGAAVASIFASALITNTRVMALPLAGLSAGSAFLGTGCIVLMPQAFFQSHISASLNLGMAFFAMGSLMAPALIALMLRSFGFRRAWCLLAFACCLGPGLVTSVAGSVPEPQPIDYKEPLTPALMRIIVTGLVIGIYLPLEKLPGRWGRLYLGEHRFPADKIGRCLVGFWVAFVLSRVLFAFILERRYIVYMTDAWLVLFLAVGAMTLLVVLTGARHRGDIKVFFIAMGALLGPILPTLIGNLFVQSELAERGLVFALSLAVASILHLTLSFLLESAMQSPSKQHVYVAPTIFAFVLAFAALTLAVLG